MKLVEVVRGWFTPMTVAIGTMMIATVLGAYGLVLDVEPGFDLGRYLSGDQQDLIEKIWEHSGVTWFAVLLLLIDSFVFVPFYGTLQILLAGGLRKLAHTVVFSEAVTIAAKLCTVGAVLADETENLLGLMALLLHVHAPAWAFRTASVTKFALVGLASLFLLALFLAWFFGRGEGSPGIERAILRRRVSDIAGRCRYVIVGIVLFAALILVMDQSRDVLIGVAQAAESRQWVGGGLVFIFSWLGLWAMAYTCWNWCRIACRLCRPRRSGDVDAIPNGAYHFARWLARLLGVAPVLLLVWLCGFAARDAIRAGASWSACSVLVFGAVVLVGAALFLRGRAGRKIELTQYYESVLEKDADRELTGTYLLWKIPVPLVLPLAAVAAMELLRVYDLGVADAPSPAFAIICLAMTLWIGVAGFVYQYSLRHSRPYMVMLLALVIAFGFAGWTDNHVVWRPMPGSGSDHALWMMWIAQGAIALILIAAAAWAFLLRARRWHMILAIAVAAVAIGVTLAAADRHLPRSLATAKKVDAPKRPAVEEALEKWLESLCKAHDCVGKSPGDAPLAVYFVSTEGGGIRAAYWTALVLTELSARFPDFDQRTFSISGVSGGAVGAAVYRTCRASKANPDELLECIQRFGRAKLLTPLLSAWMFEDIVARVIPTSLCKTPGCGVLSRGAWFEQAMESNLSALRAPLASSRPASPHLPYLFLNSTWVETGERAIASDIQVESKDFPTARDQITYLDQDLPASTAAHNAARFPYVNAIGSFKTTASLCGNTNDKLKEPDKLEAISKTLVRH